MGYCRLYEKDLRDVSEHEQENCYVDAGLECERCQDLVIGDERNGSIYSRPEETGFEEIPDG